MRVRIDEAGVVVQDPDDFGALRVGRACELNEAGQWLLASELAGTIEGDIAWLSVAGLARMAGAVDDPRFADMIAYAASKAWTNAERTLVRAHVVDLRLTDITA